MSIADPALHQMPARIATNIGWIRGCIVLSGDDQLLDVLNRHDGLLRVVDAVVPSRRERLPFFAVRVSSVSLVLPGERTGDQRAAAAEARQRIASGVPHGRVLLLLDKVSVSGAVALVGKRRVSDVFASGRSFVRVDGASIQLEHGGGQADLLDTVPEVYVNVTRVHGIADLDQHGDGASALAAELAGAPARAAAAAARPRGGRPEAATPAAATPRVPDLRAPTRMRSGAEEAPFDPRRR
jgi:hypothetical protein